MGKSTREELVARVDLVENEAMAAVECGDLAKAADLRDLVHIIDQRLDTWCECESCTQDGQHELSCPAHRQLECNCPTGKVRAADPPPLALLRVPPVPAP